MNIRHKITKLIKKNNKPIRLDNFIEEILFKKNGYYNNNLPIGSGGDYITSPEISQTFGEIIGLFIYDFWLNTINSKFNLIELGPGKGTLMDDIIRVTKKKKNFIQDCKVTLVDINKELISLQKEKLNKHSLINIKWKNKFQIYNSLPSIIFANEFLDCFPIRQFFKKNDWFEKFIDFHSNEDRFFFKNKKVKDKKILEKLKDYKKEGVAEISEKRSKYFDKICNHILKNKGMIIAIDYGYFDNIKNYTLQSINNHKKSYLFDNIGEQDITAHVNFKELIKIARINNLKIKTYCTQRQFLINSGINLRKNNLILNATRKQKKNLENSIYRLIDESQMGTNFKFLIIQS